MSSNPTWYKFEKYIFLIYFSCKFGGGVLMWPPRLPWPCSSDHSPSYTSPYACNPRSSPMRNLRFTISSCFRFICSSYVSFACFFAIMFLFCISYWSSCSFLFSTNYFPFVHQLFFFVFLTFHFSEFLCGTILFLCRSSFTHFFSSFPFFVFVLKWLIMWFFSKVSSKPTWVN